MRVMNVGGRLSLAIGGDVIDVHTASEGVFDADPQAVYLRWDEFRTWADTAVLADLRPLRDADVGPPVPRPPQVFAIGLNYADHAEEGGIPIPASPMVFTKFPACIAGPYAELELARSDVDYEAELVVVIGRPASQVTEAEAWSYVAGVTVGQDISARELQLAPPAPQQFSLAKSLKGFGPIGPAVVTPDELPDRDDLSVRCILSGETVQAARTAQLIFSVPRLIAYLSSLLPLGPGDLIFTGTPAGVGWARDPQRPLRHGDELVTEIEGIGTMRQHVTSCVEAAA
jgi:2,4-didehydro-3-deoxy-L-rhamnonate hydrolase